MIKDQNGMIYFIENYMELSNLASCCLKTVNMRMCHLDT